MNIAIPIDQDQGPDSPVCAHFGSAPMFAIVDLASRDMRVVSNRNQHHAHGQCQPLRALDNQDVHGVAVGGIGRGALNRLRAGGIQVYLSQHPTVGATLDALAAGSLQEVDPANACAHHGSGHGHGHGGHGHGHHHNHG